MAQHIKEQFTESLSHAEKYLMNQIVVIIHEYPIFGLSKIRYRNSNEEFIIDTKLLIKVPTNEHTISIGLLGGF